LRPPTFCTGCPERPLFSAMKILRSQDTSIGETHVAADIGCTTFSTQAPFNVGNTVLGYGMGNYQDAMLERLADKGNGNYGYIDTLDEAKKLLVDQLQGTLVTIAKDVKVQVAWDPARVARWRLLGYDDRRLANRDFADDRKDAGDVGVGHSVVAYYEVQPAPDALAGPNVAVTRRPDGHYILAISGRGRVDPTPQLLRFAPHFIPMFAKRWRNVFPGSLEGIRWGHETRARWKLDEPTPMERARILDPKPDPAGVRETHRRAVNLLPPLREARIANTWAGYIDSTPDGVPGIGEIPEVPGFILAAGFSGHGFGIGPGAGHLIADLVSGAQPIFDPAPFDPARFNQSSWGKVADF
jgi:hypothetical protein